MAGAGPPSGSSGPSSSRSSLDDLHFECPVCLINILPPVFQCVNGHLFCGTCIVSLVNCAVCREPMPRKKRIRSIEIEKIIMMKDHLCPYSDDCQHPRMKYEQLKDHKYECSYAPLPLCSAVGISGCKEEVKIKDFYQHLQEKHGRRVHVPRGSFGMPYSFRGPLKPTNDKGRKTAKFFHISVPEDDRTTNFTLRIYHKEDQILWSVIALGGKDCATKFGFQITLRDLQGVSEVTWKGPVLTLQSDGEELERSFATAMGYLKSLCGVRNDDESYYSGEIKLFRTSSDGNKATSDNVGSKGSDTHAKQAPATGNVSSQGSDSKAKEPTASSSGQNR